MNINASLFVQMAAIEERQKKIDEGLAAADKGEMALAEAQKEGQAIKAEARAQALAIMNDGEKRGQAIVEEAKAQAQVEADRIIEAAKAEVAQEAERLREQLRFVAKLTLKFTLKCLNN